MILWKGALVAPLTMVWRMMMSESISWSELAELTHVTQVEKFGFCTCEDLDPHEYPYPDCVKEIA